MTTSGLTDLFWTNPFHICDNTHIYAASAGSQFYEINIVFFKKKWKLRTLSPYRTDNVHLTRHFAPCDVDGFCAIRFDSTIKFGMLIYSNSDNDKSCSEINLYQMRLRINLSRNWKSCWNFVLYVFITNSDHLITSHLVQHSLSLNSFRFCSINSTIFSTHSV